MFFYEINNYLMKTEKIQFKKKKILFLGGILMI